MDMTSHRFPICKIDVDPIFRSAMSPTKSVVLRNVGKRGIIRCPESVANRPYPDEESMGSKELKNLLANLFCFNSWLKP
jgi:hypothetical protein